MKNIKLKLSFLILNLVIVVAFLSSCDLAEVGLVPAKEGTETTQSTTQVAPNFELDPETQATLEIYPLKVGSSWVYDYMSYTADQEVIWRVTETIVNASNYEGYYVAELERTADLIQGPLPQDLAFYPEAGTFWYLVDGQHIYKFDTYPSGDLSDAWLELMVPLPQGGEGWYPDPEKRMQGIPNLQGFRSASEAYKDSIPSGETYVCYNVVTAVTGGKQEATFCETVGFFFFEAMDFDLPIGYKMELRAYSLQ